MPPPALVQAPVPAPPVMMPASVNEALAQKILSLPAKAVGGCVKVRSTESTAGRQLPLPVLVSTRYTDPLLMSAALGV